MMFDTLLAIDAGDVLGIVEHFEPFISRIDVLLVFLICVGRTFAIS